MATLKKLETRIETNIKKAWYENGLCMMEIQQNGLYKKDYGTFKKYIKDRWGYSEQHGYRMIDSAETYQLLDHEKLTQKDDLGELSEPVLPENERQIRPLLELETYGEKAHVWRTVIDKYDRISARVIKDEVDAFIKHPIKVQEVTFIPKNTNVTSSKKDVMYAAGKNDECYTPDYAVKALVPHLDKSKVIWCPFDKDDSQFVIELVSAGFTVVHSHIDNGQDFYEYEPEAWDVIASNPPFTGKREIFERALSFNKPFALIMSNTWLNDSAPKQVFKARGLQLIMFEERMKFLNQDNSDNKITFSSSYFCCDILEGRDIEFDSLKNYGY